MAAPSSATLESTTRSSSARHQGQRTEGRLVPTGSILRSGARSAGSAGGLRAGPAQGMVICSPGTTVKVPSSDAISATSGRGSPFGSTRSAMVHRLSPGRTT